MGSRENIRTVELCQAGRCVASPAVMHHAGDAVVKTGPARSAARSCVRLRGLDHFRLESRQLIDQVHPAPVMWVVFLWSLPDDAISIMEMLHPVRIRLLWLGHTIKLCTQLVRQSQLCCVEIVEKLRFGACANRH